MYKSYNFKHGLLERVLARYRRVSANCFFRRVVTLNLAKPIISFSFDDAPRTAIINGGNILNAYGAKATFYVSLGMLGKDSPSGVLSSRHDLHRALEEGYEIGCHTYDHKDSYKSKTDVFVQSVLQNRKALASLFPGMFFSSFAYPICQPRISTKRRIGKIFLCCRGGGQSSNVRKADLNLLKAFFLDVRNVNKIAAIKQLIDENAEERGWLIFATHDIDDNPSRYGCSKKLFMEVVKYAAQSGAVILPVGKAYEQLQNRLTQDE